MESALSLILFAMAAVCSALMDKTETVISFNSSVFRKLDKGFWCKPVSADQRQLLKGTKYRADAWHLAKSCMVILVGLAVIFYHPVITWFTWTLLNRMADLVLLGMAWNIPFNLFYNHVFKR